MLIRSFEIGKTIYLNHQLSDGEISLPKVIRCYLRDQFGILLSGYESGLLLTHVGKGLFKNTETVMPAGTDEVTAQYIVYESDGTTPDETYLIDADIFVPATESGGGSSAPTTPSDEIAVFVDSIDSEYNVIMEDANPNEEDSEYNVFVDSDDSEYNVLIDSENQDEEEYDVLIDSDDSDFNVIVEEVLP